MWTAMSYGGDLPAWLGAEGAHFRADSTPLWITSYDAWNPEASRTDWLATICGHADKRRLSARHHNCVIFRRISRRAPVAHDASDRQSNGSRRLGAFLTEWLCNDLV